jgi:IclR family pca regulon transcriptional regulator
MVPVDATERFRSAAASRSLERGLSVLASFTPERPVRGIADIAGELGMSHSTARRYVNALTARGYLQRERSRKYRLGLRISDLGLSAAPAVRPPR